MKYTKGTKNEEEVSVGRTVRLLSGTRAAGSNGRGANRPKKKHGGPPRATENEPESSKRTAMFA